MYIHIFYIGDNINSKQLLAGINPQMSQNSKLIVIYYTRQFFNKWIF